MNKFVLVLLLLGVSCAAGNQQADSDPSLSVFFESLDNGNHFHLRVNLSSTVGSVKSTIQELGYFNSPAYRNVLLYGDRPMENDQSLQEYGLIRHSHIQYVTCGAVEQIGAVDSSVASTNEVQHHDYANDSTTDGIRLLIKYLATGNVFPITADPKQTVRALKEKIQDVSGLQFASDAQVLVTGHVVLRDESILGDYKHIKEDKTIGLVVCE